MATQTGTGIPDTNAGTNGGKTSQLISRAQEKTSELAGRAGERARDGFEQQKQRAARELHTVANVLRRGCDDGANEQSVVAPYLQRVADEVDRFSDLVESRSVDEIVRDVESFARRRPVLFLGGCFALGVAAARFLKSSDPDRNLPATMTDLGYESAPLPVSTGYGHGRDAELGYGTTGAGDHGPGYASPSAGQAYEAGRGR